MTHAPVWFRFGYVLIVETSLCQICLVLRTSLEFQASLVTSDLLANKGIQVLFSARDHALSVRRLLSV